jgi:hypothetical protein
VQVQETPFVSFKKDAEGADDLQAHSNRFLTTRKLVD